MLLGSSAMVSTFSSPTSNASDRDQLKAAAEKIMTQILLDPGYPYEWGTDITPSQNILSFGLAQYGSTSRQAYELNPDKVLRLNTTLQGSKAYNVSASRAASLLGLGNDYGFTLEFNQTLQTTASQIGTNKYSINVKSEYSLPVIAANVSAILYSVTDSQIASSGLLFNRTTYDGTCIMNFGGTTNANSRALAVAVDYYGVRTTSFLGAVNTISASLLGDNVILPQPGVSSLSNARDVILIQDSSGTKFRDFIIGVPTSPNSTNFQLNISPEPSTVGILAAAVMKGQTKGQLVIAQWDLSKISYRTIPTIRSSSMSYSLDRTVLIGGSTFLVTLYLWRMSS